MKRMNFINKERVVLFLGSVAAFFSFILFSYIVHKDKLTQFDFDTTVRLQDVFPRRVDDLFSLFSVFGHFEVTVVLLLLFLIFQRKILGIIAFVLFGFFHIIEIFGKYYVNHPPPPQFMLRTLHQVDMPQFYVSAEFSYPSGHSGRTMFLLALFLVVTWNSQKLQVVVKLGLTAFLLGYALIMVISRIYLGEHWSTDVIGGALLGLSFGLLGSLFLLPYKQPRPISVSSSDSK